MSLFVRDPFDIAPHASRQTAASWLTLVLGLAMAVACGTVLYRGIAAWSVASTSRSDAEAMSRKAVADSATARRLLSEPSSLAKFQSQEKVQHLLRMSWSGLLAALEYASDQVDGHVTVVTLAPVKTQSGAAVIGLTVLAVSDEVMVDYLRALKSDPHVIDVDLASHQPTATSGQPVLRVQLSVAWDPDLAVPSRPSTVGAEPR